MKYLLDTCIVSDFVKGELNTLNKIKQLSPMSLAISSVTVMEINCGLLLNSARAKKIAQPLNDFIASVSILAYGQEDALVTSNIRAVLRKQGQPIGAYDVLIAGTAMRHNLILVTANDKAFNRIANLKVENWRH